MRATRILAHRLRSLFSRSRVEAELERELELHISQLANEYSAAGLSEAEARLAAQRDFGPVSLTTESCRDMRGVNLVEDLGRDLLYGLRLLRRSPGFTFTAVLTLALGIGANTAVFSVIYWVLLRPLPFHDADRLVLVSEYSPGNVSKTGSPLVRYRGREAQNSVFEQAAAYWNVSGGNGLVLGTKGSAQRLQFSIVTNSFFPILGVRTAMGRTFSRAEELPGGAKVFVASYGTWRSFLNGDPGAVGKSFRLDGEPYTLVGVLPPGFNFPEGCNVWMPVGALGAWPLRDRVSHQFWMLGRLRPGAGVPQAQAEMDAIQRRFAQAYPKTDANWRVNVRPLLEEFVGGVRASMWVLFGAVGFVLLIACSNVTSLLLARGAFREREFAVRAALGAARARLLRQALAETLLIATGGATLAVGLARITLGALAALSSGSIPRFEQPHLTLAVLSFAAGLAVLTTLMVGAAPGLHASGLAFSESLQSGQRAGFQSRHSAGLRDGLVICEIAFTLLLLSGAGLMLRTFQQLRQADLGFHPDHLTSLRIALPDALYPKIEQRAAFLHQLLQDLSATPGVEMAAATDRLPLSGENNWGRINVAGRPMLDSGSAPSVEGRAVSANYFRTLGIPLIRGREFTEDDVAGRRHLTVINQEMADQFWPGADPIGQRVVSAYNPADSNEVIGVVGNIKDFSVDAQSPAEMYSPYGWWNSMNIVLRTGGDPARAVSAVRAEVTRLDREVPVYDVRSMNDIVSHSVARQRFELLLLGLFASIALLLAATGIYGLLAFSVNRRTHEIGLRIALGALPRNVLMLLVSQGTRLIVFGLVLGNIASLALTRLMSGLLYGVSPVDPLTLGVMSLLLGSAGALACWIPARRAMSVDPVIALRSE